MFMLYAIVAGLVVGLATGGRLERLARVRFRAGWLIALAMVVQLALFSSPVGAALGDLAPLVYVASTATVVAVVVANRAIPGLWLVALGGLSNLVAIVANGGYMPVSDAALQALGRVAQTGYSNSVAAAQPVLWPLTDVFALPGWVPFANVFSIGDVLIGVGAGIAVRAVVRGRAPLVPGRAEPVVPDVTPRSADRHGTIRSWRPR